jgi:asparagine synthase (glutamine-hydrolysing)
MMHAVMFKAEMPIAGLFQKDFLQNIRMASQTYDTIRRVHPATFAAFRQSPWHHYGILGLEQSQVTVRSPYLDNELVRTAYRAPGSLRINAESRWQLVQDGNPGLAELRTDRGIGGHRNAFTRLFLEFLFKAEYEYDYGMPQWVARIDHMLGRLHLERIWLGRHKPFHFRVWYRDQLANYVREMLLDSRSLGRPYLTRGGVEQIVNGHTRGNRNYTTEIHRLLSLELLHRLFLDAA